jgi:hypothetical protein
MAKGKKSPKGSHEKSPKESSKESLKESHKEASVSARSAGAKDEKKKKKSSSSSSARDILPAQPSPPLPIKPGSSFVSTQLTILKRNFRSMDAGDVVMEQGGASTMEVGMSEAERKNLESAKKFQRLANEEYYQEKVALEIKKPRSDSESETTSQSSVLNADLPVEKGNKKNVQAKLDTSPGDNNAEGKEAEMQVENHQQGIAKGEEAGESEQSFTPTSETLAGFDESPLFSEIGEGAFKVRI